jgi:hypothetical protein
LLLPTGNGPVEVQASRPEFFERQADVFPGVSDFACCSGGVNAKSKTQEKILHVAPS